MADIGVIGRGRGGLFDLGDIHRVRLINAFGEAGVPLDALLAASRAGRISLEYYDQLHATPGPISPRSYADFVASFGDRRGYVSRAFAAFGIAEPAPDTRLSVDDEAFLAETVEIIANTTDPDLSLRAIRLFGENIRRASDGALGVYGEAVARLGVDIEGLPIEETFDRVLRPWARFARGSGTLAHWLATKHSAAPSTNTASARRRRSSNEPGSCPLAPIVSPPSRSSTSRVS